MNLVFDFGAVLFQWKPAELVQQCFGAQVSTPDMAKELAHSVFGHADWHAFDRGVLDMDEVIARTSVRLGLDCADLSSLLERIGTHLAPVEATVDLLREIHTHRQQHEDYRLYFLSNMPAPYARQLESLHDFLAWFDGGVFSGDVHWIKPQPEIYQLLQQRYALDPSQTVFIDDLPGNVAAAQAQGWQGIHFQSPSQLRQELMARSIYQIRP